MSGNPFQLNDSSLAPLCRAMLRIARPLLERSLQMRALGHAYRQAQSLESGSFAVRALNTLAVQTRVASDDLAQVPSDGPVIVMANHPHGALDGLVLAAALERVRRDVRLLVNLMLQRVPELCDLCFFVDPFGGPGAARRSRTGLRSARQWLQQGHALVVFPSGEVAHSDRRVGATRCDSPWFDTAGRLAIASAATIVPAFIEGHNSRLFYAAGRVHPALRTALLPRELLARRGCTVDLRMGAPLTVTPTKIESRPSELTDQARRAVEDLNPRLAGSGGRTGQREVEDEVEDLDAIGSEVDRLPAGACLVESDGFGVFSAPASDIPRTLMEIGRLRELTYRAVGEGTGHELDLDPFDHHYTHLFAWDHIARRLVGAYRIGDVETIVRTKGLAGLYTRQLFKYDHRFLATMGPALELGRSWIRREYQKNYSALLLLWRGIGRFVVERSQARSLFGPVSISARYSDASHGLLMAFLAQNHRHASLAELVEAVHPASCRSSAAAVPMVPKSVDEADALVSRIEADGKGVPILLRQYLKLNAQLIGFNVDPEFGDALDALMLVDLTRVERALLNRYLGKDGAAAFLARHRERIACGQAA